MPDEVRPDPATLLRRRGVQVTAQRIAVLRAVTERPHVTAEDVELIGRLKAVDGAAGLIRSGKESFRQGVSCLLRDIQLQLTRDWGFSVSDIALKDGSLYIFHGSDDRVVPLDCANYLHRAIPSSHRHHLPDEPSGRASSTVCST